MTVFSRDSGEDAEQAYFSVDDGQSWFEDDRSKIPPFDKDGKPAYRAQVFKTPGGPEFVGWLERYSDANKKLIEAEQAKFTDGQTPSPTLPGLMINGMEVKKPGEKEWTSVSKSFEKAREIMTPKPPGGGSGVVESVRPD